MSDPGGEVESSVRMAHTHGVQAGVLRRQHGGGHGSIREEQLGFVHLLDRAGAAQVPGKALCVWQMTFLTDEKIFFFVSETKPIFWCVFWSWKVLKKGYMEKKVYSIV